MKAKSGICEYISNKLSKNPHNILRTKRKFGEQYTVVHSIETKLNCFLMTYVIGCIYICNAQCHRLPILNKKTYTWINLFFLQLCASCLHFLKLGQQSMDLRLKSHQSPVFSSALNNSYILKKGYMWCIYYVKFQFQCW